jgi:putative transposase
MNTLGLSGQVLRLAACDSVTTEIRMEPRPAVGEETRAVAMALEYVRLADGGRSAARSGWLAAPAGWLAHLSAHQLHRLTTPQSDERLPPTATAQASASEAGEFEPFVRRFERQILNYLWHMTGEEQSAYDLTQEVFFRAWQRFATISRYEQPRAWLFRVATNLARTHNTSRTRQAAPLSDISLLRGDDTPGASDPARRFVESELVRQVLLQLPPKRRACRLIGAHRTTMRSQRRVRSDELELRERLHVLAGLRPQWGYRRLHVLLQRERAQQGAPRVINRKRVYRLYRLEGLAVRRRTRKRVAVPPRGTVAHAWTRGQAWAMDFLQDVLADGRRFRTLNILDTVMRECLAIEVDTSLPGARVVRVLDQLVQQYSTPKQLTVDNGPEFVGLALDVWAATRTVTLDFIEPGKPAHNGYLESFNGTLRDECLNTHWFVSLAQARQVIEEWKEDYNTQRPHSALRQLPPAVSAHTIPA